jgi:hypothetical protein
VLFARSDVCAISIPTSAGGCGAAHSRPVTHGAPAKVFKLSCPPCESYLKGDGKPKILKYQIDKNTGQSIRQERVPDSSDLWSSTQDTTPLTPDEERTNATRTERGRMQIEMLQALASIKAAGINVPPEAMFLLERELPEGVLHGTMVCANGHDVVAGLKFCGECGIGMNVKAAIEPAGDGPVAVDLGLLHPQTLRKMCRERELPDKGSKDVLIGRLQSAERVAA